MYDEAIALGEGGNVEEAVRQARGTARPQDPDHALATCGVERLYGRLGRIDEAVEHAQRVCELEPDDPFSFVALSLICQKAGLIAEAEEASMASAARLQWSGGDVVAATGSDPRTAREIDLPELPSQQAGRRAGSTTGQTSEDWFVCRGLQGPP